MEIKKMTLEEAETIANQEIKRLGGYNKYRQQSMDIPSDKSIRQKPPNYNRFRSFEDEEKLVYLLRKALLRNQYNVLGSFRRGTSNRSLSLP